MKRINDSNNNTVTQSTNVTLQKSNVTKDRRSNVFLSKQKTGCTIWLTGLSSSGKTTISFALEDYLVNNNYATYTLDGDNIRCGLNSNLGFSLEDRSENIRRISEVSKLFADSGLFCITSFISPLEQDRNRAKEIHKNYNIPFVEVYVNTPINVCEERDVRGLYKKARLGLIKDFTGIDSPYEAPKSPDIILDTCQNSVEKCVEIIINYLKQNKIMHDIEVEIEKDSNETRFELFIKESDAEKFKIETENLFKLNINKIELQWVQVLSEGWAYPLNGFMNENEYLECLHFNSITKENKKYSQSIPIVLSCNNEQRDYLINEKQTSINLCYNNKVIAILKNISIYDHRKEERCCRQFGILNFKHPYIKYIYEECGDWLIGGDLYVFERIKWNDNLDEYRLTPNELRQKYKEMGADAIFAFQLRNPIHNGHGLLMRDTRKFLLTKNYKNPILLLHPLGGWTKDDDAPLNVRIEQHKAVLEDGSDLDPKSTLMAIFPSPMMYAGPTEVQWHAKARMNAGCEYYIVGRDPAGLPHPDVKKDLYDPTHGSRVLQMAPGLDRLKIVPFKVAAYNKTIKKMDYFDSNKVQDFEFISGTKMRHLARTGQTPPDGFMVEKAWNVLANYYKSLSNLT